ncbi:magnesium/cobalt transporter CorA [Cecembia calidifontis]|jgi:magnesium transporter|uniref:Magnesium transport protein CorA n=1 Tax=Cecembia calidifontis TaxID=1187080 RepID=A0A4Q7PEH4_9BACT|nr:magnesium/cobalt transporter CorA [Cecembia calidifontis]RZS98050.1 magnesium transporter [Cecembia calidifontis]
MTDLSPINDNPISLELICFGEGHFEKHHITDLSQIPPFLEQEHKFWLNVTSLNNLDLLNEIKVIFDIHSMALEDILNTQERPKVEVFDHFILIVVKMLYTRTEIVDLETEQISIVIGKNYVISFQENKYDVFDGIRSRLENPSGKIRKHGTDYFAYTLLDAIVDEYYAILEKITDQIEVLEEKIINEDKKIRLGEIYTQRKSIQLLKKVIWPTRELLSTLKKTESFLIKRRTLPFINDIYEQSVQIMDNLEMQRESITTLVEIFMTNISLRQNDVMKTLTIIATIFIPLTFLAGVYGMNFEYMPELKWKYGYWFTWIIFLGISIIMVFYFKRKRWF